MSQPQFYPLVISRLQPETDQAVSVYFDVPDKLKDSFSFDAGQYLTLRFTIDGKEERRAYSMCSAPHDEALAVTVKQVKGGIVSNYIAKELKVGDTVEVMPPMGRFLVKTDPAVRRQYYLFGAGSGITPLMSILRSVLENEPKSKVLLLYGNRDENNIIFEKQLAELEKRYAGQLTVEHTLSAPIKYQVGGLRGLFSRGVTRWEGAKGRITSAAIAAFLSRYPAGDIDSAYFVCGPGQMIDNVEATLLGHGINEKKIHVERFVSANQTQKSGGAERGGTVTVKLDKEEFTMQLEPGKTILTGLLDAGKTPPYSCLAGACSTCMAKVDKGGIKMDVCYALDDDEVAEGYILTCQSHPTTPEVSIDFNV